MRHQFLDRCTSVKCAAEMFFAQYASEESWLMPAHRDFITSLPRFHHGNQTPDETGMEDEGT